MRAAKKSAAIIVAVVLGSGLGWMAGRSRELFPAATSATGLPVDAKSRPAMMTAREGDGARGFAALVRKLEHENAGGEALASIERMSNRELRDFLTGASAVAATLEPGSAGSAFLIATRAATAELYRREGPDALTWAEGCGSKEVFANMVIAAARAEPAIAREWAERYKERHGSRASIDISRAAHHGALERGAKDFAEVDELYGEFVEPKPPAFPEGFDFEGYLTSQSASMGCRTAMQYLAASDPAMAERMFLKGIREGKEGWVNLASAALEGRAGIEGEAKAVGWVFKLLPAVPAAEKEDFLTGLVWGEIVDARVESVMKNLEEESDQQFVAAYLNHSLDSTGKGLVALRAMKDEPQRVAALAKALEDEGWPKPVEEQERTSTMGKLQALMQAVGISETGQAGLRKIVEEPAAP